MAVDLKLSKVKPCSGPYVAGLGWRAHPADPVGHGVGAGGAVVGVDDDDGDDDGGDDEDHGEEHVLPDEGHSAGGGGDELHDDQQEDGEGQQDGDGQGHLLTCSHPQTQSSIRSCKAQVKLMRISCST